MCNKKVTKEFILDNLVNKIGGLKPHSTDYGTAQTLFDIAYGCKRRCGNEGCRKKPVFRTFRYGYRKFCSAECGHKANDGHRIMNAMLKKYGVTSALKVPDIKKKQSETMQMKYGGEFCGSPLLMIKKKATMKLNHGVEHSLEPSALEKSIRRIKRDKLIAKYGKLYDTDLKEYRAKVQSVTNQQPLFSLQNYAKRGVASKNDSCSTYHIDHMYSVKQGFEDNIPPYIIGSIQNLEMLPAIDNIRKRSKCSIDKDNLCNSFFN